MKISRGLLMRAFTWVEMVVAVVVLLIIVAIIFPVLAQQKNGGSPEALSDVKQSAIANLMYAEDWDGHLPLADHWMDDLVPYVKSEDIFVDSAFGDVDEGRYGYAFFDPVEGIEIVAVENAEEVPLVFQSTLSARNAHSDLSTRPKTSEGKRLFVAFMDSHARYRPLEWPATPIVLIIKPGLDDNKGQLFLNECDHLHFDSIFIISFSFF